MNFGLKKRRTAKKKGRTSPGPSTVNLHLEMQDTWEKTRHQHAQTEDTSGNVEGNALSPGPKENPQIRLEGVN